MKLRTIRNIKNLRNTRVLVRIDANVPFKSGQVVDDSRLWAVLPTVQYLSGRGAIVILISHLGRPRGKEKKLSLAPVAKRLAQILGSVVCFLPTLNSEEINLALESAVPGQIFMLENLRFDRGEESNGGSFAKKLAALAGHYVNDAFGVSHRAHASVAAITRYLTPYAGFLMERELEVLNHARVNPRSPSVALLGGAKISTKINLIRALAKKYDHVLLGGGLANTLLAERGFKVGASLYDKKTDAAIKQILKTSNVIQPVDVLVGYPSHPSQKVRVVPVAGGEPFVICRGREGIVDIGPRTILKYATFIRAAKTVLWNGPMGIFETPKFSHGTRALAMAVAGRSKGRALGIVGGGETVEAVELSGMARYIDHISTGGGAMLEFMEGRILPGVKPLYTVSKKSKN